MYGIEYDAKSSSGKIIGQLETDAAGSPVYINPAVVVSKYDINALSTGVTGFFAGDAELHETTVKTNVGTVGSISASSSGNDFIGEISAASALAQSVKGVRIVKDDIHYMTMDLRLVSTGAPTKFLRPIGNYNVEGISSSAYTGGSGEGLIYTFTVPGGVLNQTGMATLGAMQFILIGSVGGGSGANSTVRVEASQAGASTTDILTTGATIPAGAGAFELTAKFINLATTNALRSYCSLLVNNTPYQKYTNLQGATFVSTADITIKVYITNTGSDPIGLQAIIVNML
jgi:hypothetical protein